MNAQKECRKSNLSVNESIFITMHLDLQNTKYLCLWVFFNISNLLTKKFQNKARSWRFYKTPDFDRTSGVAKTFVSFYPHTNVPCVPWCKNWMVFCRLCKYNLPLKWELFYRHLTSSERAKGYSVCKNYRTFSLHKKIKIKFDLGSGYSSS